MGRRGVTGLCSVSLSGFMLNSKNILGSFLAEFKVGLQKLLVLLQFFVGANASYKY